MAERWAFEGSKIKASQTTAKMADSFAMEEAAKAVREIPETWIEFRDAGLDAIENILDGRLWILPKEKGKKKRLRPNSEQRKFLYKIKKKLEAFEPIFLMTLKDRQIGMSTIIAAFFYELTRLYGGLAGVVTAHNKDSCRKLWKIYDRFHTWDPEAHAKDSKERNHRYKSKNQLYLNNESELVVTVAGDENFGRSESINLFHGSEAAFWKDAEGVWGGVSGALPDHTPMCVVVLESTGQQGTWFEDLFRKHWEEFLAGDEDPEWFPFFFRWIDHAQYDDRHAEQEFLDRIELTLTDEEKMLLSMVNADGEPVGLTRLAWRRKSIKRKGHNIRKWREEFPLTIDEAFSSADDSLFCVMALDRHETNCCEPRFRGAIHLDANRKEAYMIESKDGALQIWEPPRAGDVYVIGCDAAMPGQQVETQQANYKLSRSEICVINGYTGEQVATWRGKPSFPDLREITMAVSYWYNNAKTVIEAQKAGDTLIELMREWKFSNFWYHEDYKRTGVRQHNVPGYPNTSLSAKNKLYLPYIHLIDNDLVVIRDRETVRQCRTFTRLSETKIGGRGRNLDDAVDAHSMALYGARKLKGPWSLREQTASIIHKKLRRSDADERYRRMEEERLVKEAEEEFEDFYNLGVA